MTLTDDAPFTDTELAELASSRLGRLTTVDPDGAPRNNPVGFTYNAAGGTIDVDGLDMGASRKFDNLGTNPHVALVVDELVSTDPFTGLLKERDGARSLRSSSRWRSPAGRRPASTARSTPPTEGGPRPRPWR